MDIYDENTLALRGIWEDKVERQNAHIILLQAISESTELPAREAMNVLAELDRMLLKDEEETSRKQDPAI